MAPTRNVNKAAMRKQVTDIMISQQVPKGVTTTHVVRWAAGGPIGFLPGDVGRSLSFQLTDLPSVSEITALYDFYSIDKVEVQWHYILPQKVIA